MNRQNLIADGPENDSGQYCDMAQHLLQVLTEQSVMMYTSSENFNTGILGFGFLFWYWKVFY